MQRPLKAVHFEGSNRLHADVFIAYGPHFGTGPLVASVGCLAALVGAFRFRHLSYRRHRPVVLFQDSVLPKVGLAYLVVSWVPLLALLDVIHLATEAGAEESVPSPRPVDSGRWGYIQCDVP